jgi:hypothetical protein
VERVTIEPAAAGLGEMIGGLIAGNLATHPERVVPQRGRINIIATDAGASCGVRFDAGYVTVGGPLPDPDLEISTTSDRLMGLTSVPLRFGLPDTLTREGRAVVGAIASRKLRVCGMLAHVGLLSRLNRLLAI